MDARVAEFVREMGFEKSFRDLLIGLFEKKIRANPAYARLTFDAEKQNALAIEGAKELADNWGNLMQEKFDSKYLDALIKFTKSEEGQHIIFNLYRVQLETAARQEPIIDKIMAKALSLTKR